jgi:hypothetical protein
MQVVMRTILLDQQQLKKREEARELSLQKLKLGEYIEKR